MKTDRKIVELYHFEALTRSDPSKRHQFLAAFVQESTSSAASALGMSVGAASEMAFGEDIPFLLELAGNHVRQKAKLETIFHLLRWALHESSHDEHKYRANYDIIAAAWRKRWSVDGKRTLYFGILLSRLFNCDNSPEARAWRSEIAAKEERIRLQFEKQDQLLAANRAEALDAISSDLSALEAGRQTLCVTWWGLLNSHLLSDERRGFVNEDRAALHETDIWSRIDKHHQQIINIAKSYLVSPDKETRAHLKSPDNRPSNAGYRALRLLLAAAPDWINALPPAVWKLWAPAIVWFPDWQERESPHARSKLTQFALKHAPNEVARAFSSRLEADVRANNGASCIDLLENRPTGLGEAASTRFLWEPGDMIAKILLAQTKKPIAPAPELRALLHCLWDAQDADAISWMRTQVAAIKPNMSDSQRTRATVCCETLLLYSPDGWGEVGGAFDREPQLGCEVIGSIAPRWHEHRWGADSSWTPESLAGIFRWMKIHDSPTPGTGGEKDLDNEIKSMQGEILGQLGRRADTQAITQLQQLQDRFASDKRIDRALELCRETKAENEWKPLSIGEILNLRDDPRNHPHFAIMTALPVEFAAVQALLDDIRESESGNIHYIEGTIPASNGGRHGVVLRHHADTGNNIAATETSILLERYPSVRYVVMCGIACGIPNPTDAEKHLRLGDIVYCDREGVKQFDMGKREANGEWIFRHPPREPSRVLLDAAKRLITGQLSKQFPWEEHIDAACKLLDVVRPSEDHDILCSADGNTITHPDDPKRRPGRPRLHRGPIASGNRVEKNATERDFIAEQLKVIAIAMEESGVADAVWHSGDARFFVVRGISDYGDGTKDDAWQAYAAVVAASFVRAIIERINRLKAT